MHENPEGGIWLKRKPEITTAAVDKLFVRC